jgi:hypothetical protein
MGPSTKGTPMNMLRRSGLSIVAAALVAFAPRLEAQKPPTPPTTQKPPAKPPAKKAAPKSGAKAPAKAADAPKEAPKPPPPPPVVTMRTAYTSSDGQASETRLITNGTRQRVELGDGVSVITQCDTKQILQVNDKAKLYVTLPLDAAAPPPPAAAKRGGTIEYAAAFTQTGESKELFGLKATRVTTVVTKSPSQGACDNKKARIETDGWYAAVPVTLACGAAPAAAPQPAADCRDERQESATGTPPAGAPLAYTTTTYGEDGKAAGSVRMEVKDLVVAPVDAAVFEVPADYTKAADPASFVAAIERVENEARWGAPKAAGVIRIGVALPDNKTKEEISTQALAEELVDQLSKAPYEAVPLEARTPAEQVEEAKHRGCDFIVALDLTTLKSSTPGKVGGMLRKATGGGNPSELHEAKVEYRLFTPGAPPPKASKSASAKTGAFTWKRALGVARLAARLYLGGPSSMMKLMLNQSGGAGVGLPGGSADPSMNAVSLVLNLLGGGASAPVDEGSRDTTIAAALNDASTDILKELRAKKVK